MSYDGGWFDFKLGVFWFDVHLVDIGLFLKGKLADLAQQPLFFLHLHHHRFCAASWDVDQFLGDFMDACWASVSWFGRKNVIVGIRNISNFNLLKDLPVLVLQIEKAPTSYFFHLVLRATADHTLQGTPQFHDFLGEMFNPRSRPDLTPIKNNISDDLLQWFQVL